MKNFVPRHMRKRYNNKSGAKDPTKSKAFARAAAWSKRFIHQSADQLAKPSVAPAYHEWCEAARKGVLRRTSK